MRSKRENKLEGEEKKASKSKNKLQGEATRGRSLSEGTDCRERKSGSKRENHRTLFTPRDRSMNAYRIGDYTSYIALSTDIQLGGEGSA